jgi:pyrimidine oxygenase
MQVEDGMSEGRRHFRLGVFMPVGNNGWILSKTAPQYMPTYQLNRNVAELAERIGFDYLFSMAKWSGYGGDTRFWDFSTESFTMMAALAPVTTNLRLVASIAPILIHPTIVAKMIATLDDISGGRISLNVVSSDTEYTRMGLYPDNFEAFRHEYIDEWLTVVKRLWTGEPVDFAGKYFTLTGYASNPTPIQKPWPTIVYATNSEGGFRFVAEQCDEAFIQCGPGKNENSRRLKALAAERGRTVKTQAHATLILGESDADAQRIIEHIREGADLEAIANVYDHNYPGDRRARGQEILEKNFPRSVVYHAFPLIGGPERVADFIEDMAVNGDFDGMLYSFPDFIDGLQRFDDLVMPLLEKRGLRQAAPLHPAEGDALPP